MYQIVIKFRILTTLVLSVLVAFGCSNAWAAESQSGGAIIGNVLKSKFNMSGYYRFEHAFRFKEPRSMTKMRNTLFLRTDYSFSDKIKFRGSGWYYYDLVYDLFDYDTIAAREDREKKEPLVFFENLPDEEDTNVAALREFYFDVLLNNLDIRLGLQHVVWGVLEGVRIVDEINPMDFRELILPEEILDYRIPLWTVKLDYYHRSGDYQFLLIPQLAFHKPAPPGSEWELFQEVPGTIKPQSDNWRNWELGLRWSKNIFNTDLSLSYFYTWDDFPSIYRHVTSIGDAPEPILFPTYSRITMYGSTFSRQLWNFIIKGEVAYVTGKNFGIGQDPTDPNNNVNSDKNFDGVLDNAGEMQKDHIRWGIGFDFNFGGWDISPAYVQWDILDYDPVILQSPHDNSFNLYMRRNFRNGATTVTLLWIKLLDMDESYIKPRVNFRVTDKYSMSVGLDLFTGSQSSFGVATRDVSTGGLLPQPQDVEQRAQFFGNFNNNDRITVEMKYTF